MEHKSSNKNLNLCQEEGKVFWVSMIGISILVGVILPFDMWLVQLLRSSSYLVQNISVLHSLAVFYMVSKFSSFVLIFLSVFYLSNHNKIFSRITPDKWIRILFLNANWLWLYTVIVEAFIKMYSSDLSTFHSNSISTLFGNLYSFNGLMILIAKLMLLVATTRFFVAIKPINYKHSQ